LFVLTGASTSAVAAPEWQIDAPAGWSRNQELEKRFLAGRVPLESMQTELRLWVSPDQSAMLMVEWYLADLKHRTDLEVIKVLDAGPLERSQSSMRVERREKIVGSQVIRDSTETGLGMRVRRIRRYQRTSDGLHALVMTCSAAAVTPCDAAVENARLVAGSTPAGVSDADRQGSAAGPGEEPSPWRFRIGMGLGMAGIVALVVALLSHQGRSRRRRLQ
jgi:hypothetical protein